MKSPYTVQEMLVAQKQACDALLGSKTKLIGEYIEAIKVKEEDYVKEIKRQAEEIGMCNTSWA